MATKLTYSEKTNREDLSNVITKMFVDETPITSLCGTTKASGTYHEFAEDELKAPKKNTHKEGEAITAEASPSRVRKGNHTQIIRNEFSVSGTQQAVDTAGVADEYSYNKFKAAKQCALDLEYALTNNTQDIAGGESAEGAVAPEMAGIPGCVKTNVIGNKGTAREITGDVIGDALQAAYNAGGTPNKLIASMTNKRKISKMTTSNTKNVNAKDKSITEAVDVYDSDCGRIEIKASRYMPDDKVFILDPQYLRLAYLRKFQSYDLPNTFDGKSGYTIGELTLECRGEKGQAIITDIK